VVEVGAVAEGDFLEPFGVQPTDTDLDSGQREDLDMFVALARRYTPDEVERQLLRLRIPPARVHAMRALFDHEVERIQQLRDPPAIVDPHADIGWYTGPDESADQFWPAIEARLRRAHWAEEDIAALNTASTKVLARMRHPESETFTTRGLVVGHVQSGKTTNFTSVIAKAADRNYRFFVVLSGIHNALREQTQERLDEYLVQPSPAYWMPLTEAHRDFTPPANATVYLSKVGGNNHVLCVVKKNAMRLRKLKEWLQSAEASALQQCPVLIIDDEADQASVATTRINGLICGILDVLPKAAYIGYTATPFANLLIDPSAKDLYPSDFIIDLPQPTNHFGTEVIFGRDVTEDEDVEGPIDGYDMVREVPVDELDDLRPARREPADEFVPRLTPTVRQAVLYFWLATAARRVRNVGVPHSTMLIHTSMRIAVHESFREPLETLRAEVVRRFAADDRSLLEELRDVWSDETSRVKAADFGEREVSFAELRGHLGEVVGATRVVMDNSRSRERLSYGDEPVIAIAVGGNTLSRGLTLEGLVVSFFVRSTSAYDTLLQMGRWFGYRRGYADLPRIWMTDELRQWFRHLAMVEAEIRRDIRRYEEENLTPRDFAVRIRTHPALAITAASKMQAAVRAEASFGGKRAQTRYFYNRNPEWLGQNVAAARALVDDAVAIDNAERQTATEGHVIIRGVSADSIVRFLRSYSFHPDAFDLDADLIESYIGRQNEKGRLLAWNVALMSGDSSSPEGAFDFGNGISVKKIRRSQLKMGPPDYADIKTLMSKEHRVVDFTDITQRDARRQSETALMHARGPDQPGLVALYPIDSISVPDKQNEESRKPLNAVDDVMGAGIVFPGSGAEEAVTYMSADLARLGMSPDDLEQPEDEDPEAEVAA